MFPVSRSSRWDDFVIAICSYKTRSKRFVFFFFKKRGSVVSKATADVVEPTQHVHYTEVCYCKLKHVM